MTAGGHAKVNVIVVAEDNADHVRQTVNSALLQSFQGVVTTLAHDSASESAKRLAEEYADNESVRLLATGKGLAEARNSAIGACDSDYVLCLRAGDLALATYLDKTVAFLDEDPALGLVYTCTVYFGDMHRFFVGGPYAQDVIKYHDVVGPSALFRRSAWEKVGGYSSEVDGAEDWDFWVSLAKAGYSGHLCDDPLLFSRRPLVETDRVRASRTREVRRHHADIYP